jgi:hypothetical protein
MDAFGKLFRSERRASSACQGPTSAACRLKGSRGRDCGKVYFTGGFWRGGLRFGMKVRTAWPGFSRGSTTRIRFARSSFDLVVVISLDEL